MARCFPARTNKTSKKAVTILLEESLLAEVNAYCQRRHIKNIKEFMVKSMQYVLKNDKDWHQQANLILIKDSQRRHTGTEQQPPETS